MNTKNRDRETADQARREERCTAPHPFVSFLFFIGTLLGTAAIVLGVLSFLR